MISKLFNYDKNIYNEYTSEALEKIQIGLIIILFFILITIVLFTSFDLKLVYIAITLLGVIAVLVSIFCRKTSNITSAVTVLICSIIFITWLPLLFDPTIRRGDIVPLFYLALPVLIASVLVNTKKLVAIAVLQISYSLLAISVFEELQIINWISFIIFIVIMTAISMISKYVFNEEVRRNRLQQIEIEKVNLDLLELNTLFLENQEAIKEIAYFDPLTGLGNQLKLEKDVTTLIEQGKKFIAIQFSIDNFSSINKVYGYETGDSLLKKFTEILNKHIDQDVLFRWSGCEFVVLLVDRHEIKLLDFISIIEKDLQVPILINGAYLEIGFSSGIVQVPEDVNDFRQMLLYLNLATEKAMTKKDRNWELFNDRISLEILEQDTIKKIVEKSLKENGFYFEMQPMYNVENNQIICVELLLRTKGEFRHRIGPLIEIAEKFGYIIDIDKWVINTVFYNIKEFKEWGQFERVSINVSTQTFHSANFIKTISDLIKKYSVNPEKICFEIKEHTVFINREKAKETIVNLKNLGIKIALGDFGVLDSSINSLISLPYDYLKIDRLFMKNIVTNRNKQIFIRHLILLCKELNVKVVAEGIEKQKEEDILKDLGVKYLQGYLYANPYELIGTNYKNIEEIEND